MKVTLNPKLERRVKQLVDDGQYPTADALVERALASFLDLAGREAEKAAERVLARAHAHVGPQGQAPETGSGPLTGPEKARALREWAESHRPTPPLSDEAISRESIYGERA